MNAESEPGSGITFEAFFPRAQQSASLAEAVARHLMRSEGWTAVGVTD